MTKSTINDLILEFPKTRDNEKALVFLGAKGEEVRSFTYVELRLACIDAAKQLSNQTKKGDVVLLPIEDQAEFTIAFFACLLCGCVPAPLPPFRGPKDQVGLGRTLNIFQNDEVNTILISENQRNLVDNHLQTNIEKELKIITLESLEGEISTEVELPEITPEDIAYIQYTSGSTSTPKGVVLRHRNVICNLGKMYRVFQREDLVRVAGWIPFYHDMGLVGHLFTVLFESGYGVFLPPSSFLSSPQLWIQTISDYKATAAAAPTFALEQCTLRVEAKESYDLSSLKHLYVGSETVSYNTLDQFVAKFSAVGFDANSIRSVYGLAEATLLVAGGGLGFEDVKNRIETRKTGVNHERMLMAYRIDPEIGEISIHDLNSGHPLAEGEIGEIHIRAPHNSEEYFGASEQQTDSNAPLVKTGDLGYIRNGFLYLTGRSKETVIVRGVNYSAEDLEFSIRQNEHLILPNDESACVSHIDAQKERLLVFQEVHRHTPQRDLKALADRISGNMLENFGVAPDEVHLIPHGLLPKTPNFKIARLECLNKYLAGDLRTIYSHIKTTSTPESADEKDSIVVVGMACKFPGGAENLEKFWQLLSEGFDGISEIPETRWDHTIFYDQKAAVPGKMNTKWSGFIEEIEQFDASLFNVSVSEAPEMDPQQRMLLETSWRLLENTGWKKEDLANSDTGVFVGIANNDYLYLKIKLTPDMEGFNAYSGLGNSNSVAANRLSYFYDLKGPSLAIDTACSSSLTALHLAAKSIENGDCKQAIVGGVNAIISPGTTITLSQFGMMSPEGRCKAFGSSADGYVRSEGCGLVMLKKQSDALHDGDKILAKLVASSAGQDGHSPGMTFPNGAAQYKLISHTLEEAGLKGAAISYVEAHGTGTPTGDPVEVSQIARHYGGQAKNPCYVGSVKANIGHLETAAGIAGFIKSVLMLQHKKIPPQIHINELNPRIQIENTRLKIPTQLEDWHINSDKRRAAISSFGFGGSLAHAILEEPDEQEVHQTAEDEKKLPKYHYRPFLLSGHTKDAIKAQAQTWIDWLNTKPSISTEDICCTQALNRSHLNYREYLLVQDKKELREKLERFITRPSRIAPVNSLPKQLCFLFTGQGEHYVEMGKDMYVNFPAFKKAFDRCAKIMDDYGHLSKPFKDLMFQRDLITEEYDNAVQPGLFAIQYALMMQWQECGITPHIMLGHSLGEFAAACMAGCMEPETAIRILKKRAELVASIEEKGRMVTIFTSLNEVLKVMDPNKAEIACINSPEKIVVSGEAHEIQRIVDHFTAEGVRNFALRAYMAFHSRLLDPILEEYEEFLSQLTFKTPSKRWVSSVTGEEMKVTPNAKYWVDHLRNTVQFQKATDVLKEEGVTQFLEVGPSGNTLLLVRECLNRSDLMLTRSISRGEKDRNEMRTFFDSIGKLYQEGYTIHWETILPGNAIPDQIPGLKFAHKPYWIEGLNASSIAKFAQPIYGNTSAISHEESESTNNWHYALEWVDKGNIYNLNEITDLSNATSWIIFGSNSPLELELGKIAKSRGHEVYRIAPHTSSGLRPDIEISDNPTQQEFYNGLTKVFYELSRANVEKWKLVYVPNLSMSENSGLQVNALESGVRNSLDQFIPFLKALKETVILPPIWIPTIGSQKVNDNEAKQLNIQLAPLWGFAKTLFLEQPEWRGGLIDLDPAASTEENATNLVSKILKPTTESAIAIRSGRQYVQQLAPKERPPVTNSEFRADGAFVITGGLGGLGLKTAEWVLSKGGKHLVLMGRRTLPPQAKWASISEDDSQFALIQQLLGLKEKGANLEIASQDVRDIAVLESLFDDLTKRDIPIRGVIHAAGVNWFAKIMDLNEEEFFDTLKIKVSATWALHNLVQDDDLDCFIMFSSVSALWGSVNLSHYTAANLFMDMVSHYRSSVGQKSLCVDWGPWADVGMSSKTQEKEVLDKIGFKLIPPIDALRAMEAEMDAGSDLSLIADIDWNKYQVFIDFTLQPSLFEQVSSSSVALPQGEENDLDYIINATPEKARSLIEEVVRVELRSVILLESADRVPAEQRFNFLGMDSLMAILLATKLEQYFNIKLPNTLAYNYPHIKAVSDYLFELVYLPHHDGAELPNSSDDTAEESETVAKTASEDAGVEEVIASEPEAAPIEKEEKPEDWFRTFSNSNRTPDKRIFCFPYAGSGASVYANLAKELEDLAELIAIQPPGKEDRSDEKLYTSITEIVQALLKHFEPPTEPYYLFGHSLGSLVAYEFYLGLKKQGKRLPEQLFISGSKAPGPRNGEPIHNLPEDEFIEAVLSKYTNAADRETRKAALKHDSSVLRADVTMLETYAYSEEDIEIPFTAIAGYDDPLISPKKLRTWGLLAASEFKLSYINGDHNLITGSWEELAKIISDQIGGDILPVNELKIEEIEHVS